MAEVSDFTALLYYPSDSYGRWNSAADPGVPSVVTYSFVETGDLGGASNDPFGATNYWSFDNSQRAVFRQAAEDFEDAAGLVFVEVEGPAMINIFGYTGGSAAGWANLPWASPYTTGQGHLAIQGSNISPGSYGYETLLHELGHSLGLKHPHDGDPTLAPHLDHQENTVMTYSYAGYNVSQLGPLDIQALQHIYGGAGGTDGWSAHVNPRGEVVINASNRSETVLATGQETKIYAKGGQDTVIGREADDRLFGGGGSDLLIGNHGRDWLKGGSGADVLIGGQDRSGYSGSRSEADVLTGNSGADQLFGGHGRDKLHGGSGSDRLVGGAGPDVLSGGNHADVFVFVAADYGEDEVILDFGKGNDRIEFSGTRIDQFSDLTIEQRGGHTFLSYQDNHDIKLKGYTGSLSADDFLFT